MQSDLSQALQRLQMTDSVDDLAMKAFATKVAVRLRNALSDPDHVLAIQFKVFAADIEHLLDEASQLQAARTHTAGGDDTPRDDPRAAWFYPRLGSSVDPRYEKLWELQLLLSFAGRFAAPEHREKLAEPLGLTADDMMRLSDAACPVKLGLWSERDYRIRLMAALESLGERAPIAWTLRGREVVQGDCKVHLSSQEATLLRVLEESRGTWVALTELQAAHDISRPSNVKRKILKKAVEAGITIWIESGNKGYRIP